MIHWQGPSHSPGTDLRSVASAPHWEDAANKACDQVGRPGGTWEMFSSGSDVVMGDESRVFKLTHPRWAKEIDAEANALKHLQGKLSIQTPGFLAQGKIDGWPWLLMERLPGRSLASVWGDQSTEDRRRLAHRLGEIIAELHRIPHKWVAQGEWAPFLATMKESVQSRHKARGASSQWIEGIPGFLDGPLDWGAPAPVLLHTEVLDEHVWVDERDGRIEIVGLIDFADSRVGHPGYEFPALADFIFKGERPLMRACLLGYGIPPKDLTQTLSETLLRWGLLHQFGHLPRMLRACGAPEPKGFQALAQRLFGLGDA